MAIEVKKMRDVLTDEQLLNFLKATKDRDWQFELENGKKASIYDVIGILQEKVDEQKRHSERKGLTNAERFTAVFGFVPDDVCIMPEAVCPKTIETMECKDCPYKDFWTTNQQITEKDYHEVKDDED